ncbi:MAG: 30S ribosomal protein S12 methylthiotransferase RimO [Erysipelotrichaceae bacterium]|nr:30S ribosomal protein S12 methylthiotransferase RimO [Erysipelotrichaceae bacterium]
MKVGMISLGCCKNLVDSEKIMGLLVSAGCTIVSDAIDADVLVVNTCGFIEPAKEEAINTILEMAEYKEYNCKKLIVTGCLAKRYKDALIEEMPEVDAFIGVDEYEHLPEILHDVLGLDFPVTYGKCERLLSTNPWMAYLRIADGCDNRCSYCAIPLIRGNYRSVPMETLLQEAQELADKGVKELVLIAQDTTRYGTDLYGRRCLPDLLKALDAIEGFHWIRVLYTYPDELDDELIEGMKDLKKVLPYFDIPIQHGDNEMLIAMNRRGTIESIQETIDKIKKLYPMPVFRTTMIVGFPGETEEMFENMMKFIKEVRWDRLGAFTYSHEEDTPSYYMPDEPAEEVKQERYHRLMALQKTISDEKANELIGQTLEVLVEKQDGLSGRYYGRSVHSAPDGIDGSIIFKSDRRIEFGTFVNVKILSAKDYDCFGEAVYD